MEGARCIVRFMPPHSRFARPRDKGGGEETAEGSGHSSLRPLSVSSPVRGSSMAITASRHHLYLRDTAMPCPGRIVTARGPYGPPSGAL